jgi:hypothetical protein
MRERTCKLSNALVSLVVVGAFAFVAGLVFRGVSIASSKAVYLPASEWRHLKDHQDRTVVVIGHGDLGQWMLSVESAERCEKGRLGNVFVVTAPSLERAQEIESRVRRAIRGDGK